jgi:hypothetical protein
VPAQQQLLRLAALPDRSTAASQRIHYPYSLYLVFWSCFLRRIQGVSNALSARPKNSADRFFWLISSESCLARSQSSSSSDSRRFPVHSSCFCTGRSPISENPFDQCYQWSGFGFCLTGSFFLNPVLPDHGRLRPIGKLFPVHSSFFCTSRSRSLKIRFISVISG